MSQHSNQAWLLFCSWVSYLAFRDKFSFFFFFFAVGQVCKRDFLQAPDLEFSFFWPNLVIAYFFFF